MAKRSKHPNAGAKRSAGPRGGTPVKKQTKRPTNLTLDPEAVSRGERFGQRHGASLSQLVTGFLYSLPVDDSDVRLRQLTPPVRRLFGLAATGTTDRATYRDHLTEKYGGQ